MAELPSGLSSTPPPGLSATPPEGLSTTPPPGLSLTPPEVEETGRNRKQFYDDNVFGELGEGIVSGLIGAGEGVIGLGALAVDIVADTDYGDKVANAAESARDALGLDPEGIVGKGAEIITQFVVPGGLAAKGAKALTTVGRAARAAKVAKNPVAKGFGNKVKGLVADPKTVLKDYATDPKRWETAAFAGADFAVATGNEATLGDWVEAGPTQTTELIGLRGREKALARLGNRAKVAAEGGVLGEAAQGILGAAGKTIGDAKITKDIAGATRGKIDQATKSIDTLLERRMLARPGTAEELGKGKAFIADAIAFGRYRGYLPSEVAEKRLLMDGIVSKQVKRADRILNDLDREIDGALKNMPEGDGNLDKVGYMTKIENYLTEADEGVKKSVLAELPKGIRQNALRMRKHIEVLSKDVLDSNYLKEKKYTTPDGLSVDDVINKNINNYLRRRYKIFEDKKYVPTDESIKNADSFFRRNKPSVEKELTEAYRKDVDNVFNAEFFAKNGLTRVDELKTAVISGNNKGKVDTRKYGKVPTGKINIKVGNKVTADAGRVARENFLNRYTIEARVKSGAGRVATDRLETGMFLKRKKIAPELQDLLGIVKDPRQAYLGTVADLAQFTAVDDYFGTIAKLADENSGIGKFFKNGNALTNDQQEGLLRKGFVKLGGIDGKPSGLGKADPQGQVIETDAVNKILVEESSGWGELDGYFVPKGVYNNLTNHVLAEDGFGANLLNNTVGRLLKLKGVSQYAKTVLSPITQVRNFTTAALFATANGNMPLIGRGSKNGLRDAWKTVHANVTNKGDDAVFLDIEDAFDRGVMGTNAELREIQDTLSKGLDLDGKAPTNFVEATFGESIAKSKIAGGAKFMEDVYQGSDDFWKYFNYNAEQSQIRHMLKEATPEEQVAYLTKNGSDPGRQGSVGDTVARNEKIKRGEIDLDMIDELVKDRAAQIVRDTVPNYNKGASDAIKLGRKLPVGNFITFPAEMFRTSFNIVKQGLDDMGSEIPAVQARGRGRLTGFVGTTVVAPAAVTTAMSAATGISKEEMAAYQRSFAAPWEKGAVLVPIGRNEDGTIRYINYSTSNPYDVVSRFATRALNEADEAIKQGKSPSETFTGVIGNTVTEFFQPFLSEAMLTEAVTDVFLRGGKTATGAKVWNPVDDAGTIGFKAIMHVVDTVVPGIVPVNISGGVPEPSRFLRGVMPGESLVKYKDKMGRERTFIGEMARAMSGVSVLEFDPKKGLEYGGFRMQRSQTDAKSMFNKVVDDENGDAGTLFNGFRKANEAKYRVDKEYYQMIEDLRTMGMTNSEIRKVLKQEGVGGTKGIMRGEFEPFKVSAKNKKDMRKAGIDEFYPREQINQLRKDMNRLPLAPDDPSTIRPRPTPNTSTPPAGLSLTPPTGLSLTPPPGLSPSTQAAPPVFQNPLPPGLSPALTGGDPNTQEIARRLGLN